MNELINFKIKPEYIYMRGVTIKVREKQNPNRV